MNLKFTGPGILLTVLFLLSCSNDSSINLPSAEFRTNEAISALKSALTAQQNGWKVEYQPTAESGIFFMILKFKEDGSLTIKSDVADQNGEFFNQDITWRIDSRLGLKLVLETYSVFHYLFEQDAATFGAEFEFIYQNVTDGNLVFSSASDLSSSPTTLVFQPAGANDDNLFARDIAGNLNQFSTIAPKALQSPVPKQQIILTNADVSILWSLDPAKRIINTILAGSGDDFEDPAFKPVTINQSSGYELQDGNLILKDPLSFTLKNGKKYTLNSISFTDFSNTGPAFCSQSGNNGPEYKGQVSGIGPVTMTASLYDPEGANFQPEKDFPYSVNIPFLFDESGASLSDQGHIISQKFPGAAAFLFYYGYTSDTDSLPPNAVGFVVTNTQGTSDLLLREFQPTQTIGNRVLIQLTNNFYYTGTPGPDDENNLAEITDLLFEGGNIYVSDFPVQGLTVFNLFNPCNQYEIFLVQ